MIINKNKTPLRYPGGKSRATKKLFNYMPNPNSYSYFREPFVGGGSVSLYVRLMNPHVRVWINDLYEPLYNFWSILQQDGENLTTHLLEQKNTHNNQETAKVLFLEAKDSIGDITRDATLRAADFYIINKCSFSGLTESSSFSKQASDQNFTIKSIEKLVEYSNIINDWKITNLSYEELLSDCDDCFVYLDPPYEIGTFLYGKKGSMHKGFNHDEFAKSCDESKCRQLISYNASQLIKNRFEEWQTSEFDHTYTMRSVGSYQEDQQERKELVLLNYDLDINKDIDENDFVSF